MCQKAKTISSMIVKLFMKAVAFQIRKNCWKGWGKSGEAETERWGGSGCQGQDTWTSTSGLPAEENPVSICKWSLQLLVIRKKHLISDHQLPSYFPHLLGKKTKVHSQCVLLTGDLPLTASFTTHFLNSFCYSSPNSTPPHIPPTVFIYSNVR